MSKKSMIRIAYAVVVALIILILYLIIKSGNGDWVWAIIMTLIMGEAYLLVPKKWFVKFKRKEKNPLLD
jgi:predicted MFS family arabinose efflux permease